MWQLGLRYDTIDLNDGTRPGATPTPPSSTACSAARWTPDLGVNWYWRSNFKFMLNYVKVNSSVHRPHQRPTPNPANNAVNASSTTTRTSSKRACSSTGNRRLHGDCRGRGESRALFCDAATRAVIALSSCQHRAVIATVMECAHPGTTRAFPSRSPSVFNSIKFRVAALRRSPPRSPPAPTPPTSPAPARRSSIPVMSKWSADYAKATEQQGQLPVDRLRRRHRPDQGRHRRLRFVRCAAEAGRTGEVRPRRSSRR